MFNVAVMSKGKNVFKISKKKFCFFGVKWEEMTKLYPCCKKIYSIYFKIKNLTILYSF